MAEKRSRLLSGWTEPVAPNASHADKVSPPPDVEGGEVTPGASKSRHDIEFIQGNRSFVFPFMDYRGMLADFPHYRRIEVRFMSLEGPVKVVITGNNLSGLHKMIRTRMAGRVQVAGKADALYQQAGFASDKPAFEVESVEVVAMETD